ncbi:MAG: hypothetical protein E6Q67_03045 [Roseateles sp.]|nr:MAG: hypothetical protein E6Q67_03045 [Roseateles sp.]
MNDTDEVRAHAAWFEHGVNSLMLRCGVASIAIGGVAGLMNMFFSPGVGAVIAGMTVAMAGSVAMLGQLTAFEARQRARSDQVQVDRF